MSGEWHVWTVLWKGQFTYNNILNFKPIQKGQKKKAQNTLTAAEKIDFDISSKTQLCTAMSLWKLLSDHPPNALTKAKQRAGWCSPHPPVPVDSRIPLDYQDTTSAKYLAFGISMVILQTRIRSNQSMICPAEGGSNGQISHHVGYTSRCRHIRSNGDVRKLGILLLWVQQHRESRVLFKIWYWKNTEQTPKNKLENHNLRKKNLGKSRCSLFFLY